MGRMKKEVGRKKLYKKVNQLALSMREMTDEELQSQTLKFRERLASGASEASILEESFAVVREASYRVLGLYATEEQVLGALALNQGYISEIKTGEGKSLVATMPLYFKALTMRPAFLVTTNDYLAHRDYLRIGPVFEWLGLRVADGTEKEGKDLGWEENIAHKKSVYGSDVIYISNGTLGFDFLFDRLASREEERFLSPLNFALLDEVDSILLDSAQQPLVISGNPKVQSNYFKISDSFIQILKEGEDYEIDSPKRQVWLTEQGIEHAKTYFSVEGLLEEEFFGLYQHIVLALKAHYTMKKNKDYIVEDDKIKLVDSKDGRVLEGINLQNGLHQALETKEGVELTKESQTISSITFQNLFRQFKFLAGMSGTAKVAEDEFIRTYNLPVKCIQTRKKNIRKDHKPEQFTTLDAKVSRVLEVIASMHREGRPVLVITGSVSSSELISLYLLKQGLAHNVLNAKSSVKEAQIIKEAGQVGAITVSTSMAGRGTDIKLTSEAIQAGGLAVIITERMTNERIELQAKGRSGRQGEPGDTYVFECLEDDVIRRYMQDKVQKYYDRNRGKRTIIRRPTIRRVFRNAQKISEEKAFSQRGQSLQFDEVMRLQKRQIDLSRGRILDLESIPEALEVICENVPFAMAQALSQDTDVQEFHRFLLDYVDYNFKVSPDSCMIMSFSERVAFVQRHLQDNFKTKRENLNDDRVFLLFLKACMLRAIDDTWSSQVDTLNQLRFLVQNRSIAQKQPILEFEKEAQSSYKVYQSRLAGLLLRNTALSLLEIKKKQLVVTFP